MKPGETRSKIREMMRGSGFRKRRTRKSIKRPDGRSKQNLTCIKAAEMRP